MNLQEFVQKMKTMVQEHLGSGHEVISQQVKKNNGIVLEALTIREDGSNIAPTIYIEPFYHDYMENELTLIEAAKNICEAYQNSKVTTDFDVNSFCDFSQVRDRIIYKLVNYEKNKERLDGIPHDVFLDFAIIYCVLIEQKAEGYTGTILIHYNHLVLWGIYEEDLKTYAMKNTPALLASELLPMKDVINQMIPCEAEDKIPFDDAHEVPMYILSNKCKLDGATCLLYPGLLEKIATEWNRDFYVLPSSIHETILIPKDDSVDAKTLSSMVKEVNDTQVMPAEILSDHAYVYSHASKQLMAA